MKISQILALGILATTAMTSAQDNPAPAPAAATPARKAQTPKQQITGFYAMCKQDRAAEGLQEMLSSNPVVKDNDVTRVAQAFGQLVAQMGKFVDFEISKETQISKRTLVVRCIPHFERQPFTNEFTFYDPGNGDWRLVHLRYDANLASMFQEDLTGVRSAESQ